MTDSLRAQAEAWLADDPDPETRAALQRQLDNPAQLKAWFAAPLSFGTAGLRGELGPGPARMNRRVVARTTRGLCDYLAQEVDDAAERGLCVARDARHGSAAFADEVVRVALGAGFVVHLFEAVTPTPLLAYAVRALNAAGGVMVTASHNPKADNGYKVYFEGGAQLVAPHDAGIARAAEAITRVCRLPRMSPEQGRAEQRVRALDGTLNTRYRDQLKGILPQPRDRALIRIAYTPLHGVAGEMAQAVLADAGFSDVRVVTSQAAPDPDFPTLRFPNPEEPGTVDALLSLASDTDADVAIANDPDGDRLALGVRDDVGQYRLLTGNETGLLLTDYALERYRAVGAGEGRPPLVCSTIVSSPMIARIAASHGARLALTLTGFKWMFARVSELEAEGHPFVFGFEDAMGYAATPLVRDKDGLSAAVLAAQLTASCRALGIGLWQRLTQLFVEHGHYLSAQRSQVVAGPDAQTVLAERMRKLRGAPPVTLAGAQVLAISDYLSGLRHGPGGTTPLELPTSDVLVLELEGEQRLCIRPSGTEPKLKLYFDIRTVPLPGDPMATTQERANKRLQTLIQATNNLLG